MATQIYLKKGTDAERQGVVLGEAEPGYTTDEEELWIGDGTTSGGLFIGPTFVNDLKGDITISGIGGTVVDVDGQTITISGGGGQSDVASFTDLDDVPGDYAGLANQVIAVNATEDALETIKAINMEVALESDEDYSGWTVSGVAGETLAFGDVVYYGSDSKWGKTIATVEAQVDADVALVVLSGVLDSSITLLKFGCARYDSWSWSVPDRLWIDTTSGSMSATQPTVSGEFVKFFAWVKNTNVIFVKPNDTIIKLK